MKGNNVNLDKIIELENVNLLIDINKEKIKGFKKIREKKEVFLLKDISFTLQKGEGLAVLGIGESGKTSLLRIISGIMNSNSGKVEVNGETTTLLSIESSFDLSLTGKENIYYLASLFGISKKHIKTRYKEIVDFCQLNEWVDIPLKNYSISLKTKLALTLTLYSNCKILVYDEMMNIKDDVFYKKFQTELLKKKSRGVTIVSSSKNGKELAQFCEKAVILDKGKLIFIGDYAKGIALINK